MIESLVRQALAQRLIVVVVSLILLAFGLNAARKLSLDAFPDVTNVQVQIATEALGRSPEEVERFATVPIEIAMNLTSPEPVTPYNLKKLYKLVQNGADKWPGA